MPSLVSILLPFLLIRLSLFTTNIETSALSCPIFTLPTATAQYSHFNSIPSASFFLTRRQSRHMFHSSAITFRQILFTLLLSGDIETNPGPITGSLRHTTSSSNKNFLLYSLNIRSLLNPKNSIVLSDLASCPRPPDLIALQETWISASSSRAHIADCKPPGYSLQSFLRSTSSSKSAKISGGGTAFLVREPAVVLNSSCHSF